MKALTRIALAATLAAASLAPLTSATAAPAAPKAAAVSPFVAANDGTPLYVKDWGPKDGPVVVFSHGWPLSADSWESQMQFL
ncbi:alpha/beta fold hydrolase, partial [Klebsiella pneumoniae]|uniref:alpha/beta fold hydrolase n=1 Tax=Klebsiella pneumoniae TaxID=573 RepID=UPI0027787CBE|nr:hypothetical protein [Klebsiella pneumoniae]